MQRLSLQGGVWSAAWVWWGEPGPGAPGLDILATQGRLPKPAAWVSQGLKIQEVFRDVSHKQSEHVS